MKGSITVLKKCMFMLLGTALGLVSGCATTGASRAESETASGDPSREQSSTEKAPATGRTVQGTDFETLGEFVRAAGEGQNRGGIVLLDGLEVKGAPPITIAPGAYKKSVKEIAQASECLVTDTGSYHLIYPPGYEILLETLVGDSVPPKFQELRGSFAIGAGTRMYNALAQTIGVTIVADNGIADVFCGELFVCDAPVPAIVEALLQSARIPPDAVAVESTDSYIFIRTTSNQSHRDTGVDQDKQSAGVTSLLAKRVQVQLPFKEVGPHFQDKHVPLSSILKSLSDQVGVPVTADLALADFPVYQMKFIDVPVADVFNLIIRSWPIPQFGYRADESGIRFFHTG